MVSLWDMLSLFSGCAAFGGAFARAGIARAGPLRSTMCCASGIVIGILGVVAMWAARRLARARMPAEQAKSVTTPRWLPLLYVGGIIWIPVLAFVGYKVAALIA